MKWVTAQRGVSAGQLDAAVTAGDRRGALLVGQAGVGKTVLARAAAERFTRRYPKATVHWISATASASRVPFGAFSHLVEVSGTGEPATLLTQARTALCPAGANVLVVVDDAHLLDNLSATLVHQVAVTASARLILTHRSTEQPPDAVTALWKDEVLARLDIEPFDTTQTTRLVEAVLGGPLESASAIRIFNLSEGNPLYLRHLVDGAVQAGRLRAVDGVWQLRGEMSLTAALSDLISGHLSAMPEAVRNVLQYLAVEEPLPVPELSAVAGADAVEAAEAVGAVTVVPRGADLVVQPVHPLYTETLRGSLGLLTARRLRTELVEQFSARPATHLSDRLRWTALAIDSDRAPEVPDILTAAWQAMQLGDLALGERLARGALDRADGLPARLALAHSLSWQGRGRDTDDALSPVDTDALSEWELTAWLLPKVANQFWMLRESEKAVRVLHETRARISEPAPLNTIDALAATFAMNAGRPAEAVEIATGVLAAPTADDLAVAWAASAAALSSARMGRFSDVDTFTERCLSAAHPGLVRYASGLGQVQTALLAGAITRAEELARHYLGFAEFEQPGRAIGEVILGQVLMAKGELDAAVTTLRHATAALRDTGYSWGPMGLMHLTKALGQQGLSEAAAEVLGRAQGGHGMRSELYSPELHLARAWTMAAGHDLHGAMAAAREAARGALRSGQRGTAMLAFHDAVRLGDTAEADGIVRLAAELDCVLGHVVVRHVRALTARNGQELSSVADEFEELGMTSAAADAAAQSAIAHGGTGNRKQELAARGRAGELAQRSGSALTPALEKVLNPLPLTGREREVAIMVSSGLSNKDIAVRLSISVRTVEGHIYRACIKLDVEDRTMLAQAVAASRIGTEESR